MGGMSGQMGQGGPRGEMTDGQQGQMTPPTQGQNGPRGEMTGDRQRGEMGQNDPRGQMTPPTQEQNGGQQQTAPAADARQETLTVAPTTQNLTVDGAVQNAEIYNINGSNYFKLRDIAMLLSGTGAQFSVDYDAASRTIIITTGQSYAPQGGELERGTDRSASCVRSAQTLVIDGRTVALTAYNLGGNNFFRLRELGAALGFGVDYDETTRTMLVTSI